MRYWLTGGYYDKDGKLDEKAVNKDFYCLDQVTK